MIALELPKPCHHLGEPPTVGPLGQDHGAPNKWEPNNLLQDVHLMLLCGTRAVTQLLAMQKKTSGNHTCCRPRPWLRVYICICSWCRRSTIVATSLCRGGCITTFLTSGGIPPFC